jgi:hypothetical protein
MVVSGEPGSKFKSLISSLLSGSYIDFVVVR